MITNLRIRLPISRNNSTPQAGSKLEVDGSERIVRLYFIPNFQLIGLGPANTHFKFTRGSATSVEVAEALMRGRCQSHLDQKYVLCIHMCSIIYGLLDIL